MVLAIFGSVLLHFPKKRTIVPIDGMIIGFAAHLLSLIYCLLCSATSSVSSQVPLGGIN